jgi:hypothetical protein
MRSQSDTVDHRHVIFDFQNKMLFLPTTHRHHRDWHGPKIRKSAPVSVVQVGTYLLKKGIFFRNVSQFVGFTVLRLLPSGAYFFVFCFSGECLKSGILMLSRIHLTTLLLLNRYSAKEPLFYSASGSCVDGFFKILKIRILLSKNTYIGDLNSSNVTPMRKKLHYPSTTCCRVWYGESPTIAGFAYLLTNKLGNQKPYRLWVYEGAQHDPS